MVSGEPLDREALTSFAQATGYVAEDRVDGPGEFAVLGEIIDIYPADAALPVRIALDPRDVITALHVYDPLTQRSNESTPEVTLGPASELVSPDNGETVREHGAEHRMSLDYGSMPSLFDLIPKASVTEDILFQRRLEESLEQIDDAYDAQTMLRAAGEAGRPERGGLYLNTGEVADGIAGWNAQPIRLDGISATPSVAGTRNPGRAFCEWVQSEQQAGRRVIVAGLPHEQRPLARALARGLKLTPTPVTEWSDVMSSEAGARSSLWMLISPPASLTAQMK